jgi:uncharacterized protein (TIGR00369 family)
VTESGDGRVAAFNDGSFDAAIFETLGAVVEEAAGGRGRVRYPHQARFAIPSGAIQGGIQAALIDEAMIVALRGLTGGATHYTTAELRVNYLRPALGREFVAEAEVVRRGRTVAYVEASLRDDQGRLVARASSTLVRVARGQVVER